MIASILFGSIQIFAEGLTKEEIRATLPKYLGSSNSGTEFFMTFHPCLEEVGYNNALKIYVSSGKATQVTLRIPGTNYSKVRTTIPNDIIEFSLDPSDGQPYTKDYSELPQPSQVFKGRGIIITADEPIICYGVTRYQYTSDGYLALPKSSLGKKYLVSSYSDLGTGWSGQETYNSFTSIVAAYDNTRVTLRLGGTTETYIIQKNGPNLEVSGNNTSIKTMHRGDVWLIASRGNWGDLSGSVVQASKPVAVISGSFCAFVPRGVMACDFLIEQELPVKTWGTKYHVSPIAKRKKSSFIKLYASEANTQLYQDGDSRGSLSEVGGVENDGGFIHRRLLTGEEAPRPVTISSDKPISITQYNTGQNDDGVPSDPFQMVLTPIEQYQTEIIFNTPGVSNSQAIFRENYINLVYLATEAGTVPDDLEWAQVVNGKFHWKKVADVSGGPGGKFYDPDFVEGNRYYHSKTIPLPDPAGVYKIRAKDPFAAYAYGFSDYDSYGYPTSVALADLSKPDTLPPRVEYTMDCLGNIEGLATDEPEYDDEIRSNMRFVYLESDSTTNYIWKDNKAPEFEAGYDAKVPWSIEVKDPSEDARAFMIFTDGRGNETIVLIEYFKTDISIIKSNENWGLLASNSDPVTKSFTLVNNRDKVVKFESMELILKSVWDSENGGATKDQGFEINKSSIDLSGTLQPHEERTFEVTFDPSIVGDGVWRDSIGVSIVIDGTECYLKFLSEIKASIGTPEITVSDIEFPRTTVGKTTNPKTVIISNPGSTALTITGYSGPTFADIYEEDLPDVTPENPIVIQAGETRTYTVKFTPDAVKSYPDEIVFESDAIDISDTEKYDPVGKIGGEGMMPGLEANGYDWGRKRVNLDKYDSYPYRDKVVYEVEGDEKVITLSNNESEATTVISVTVEEDINGEAFEIMNPTNGGTWIPLNSQQALSLFKGIQVAPGDSIYFPIRFVPVVECEHKLLLTYESSAGNSPQTELTGIGIYPKISISSINFTQTDPAIAKDNPITKTFEVKCLDWGPCADSVEIQDFIIDMAGTIVDDGSSYGTEAMKYNKYESVSGPVTYPLVLQPGESIEFEADFAPQSGRSYEATLTTYSDADYDSTSTWVGEAIEQGWGITGDEITLCINNIEDLTATITNTGNDDLLIEKNGVKLVDANGEPYSGNIFTLKENSIGPFVVKPGKPQDLYIEYAPTAEGTETVEVQVTTNAIENSVDIATLTGTAVHYPRTTSAIVTNSETSGANTYIDFEAGKVSVDYTLQIDASGSDMTFVSDNNTTLDVKIEYPLDFLGLDEKSVAVGSGLPGFEIKNLIRVINEVDSIETITMQLVGNSAVESGGDIEILTMRFNGFLPKSNQSAEGKKILRRSMISHEVIDSEPCVTYNVAQEPTVVFQDICVDDLRPVYIWADGFDLQEIKQNPVGSEGATINYSIGLDNVNTQLNIYDAGANLVASPVSGALSSGKYSVELPDLSSGVYFYVMQSGPFYAVRKVVVRK